MGLESSCKAVVNGSPKALEGGDFVKDQSVTEEAILFEANAYALASHFLWGLWSVIQSRISGIKFAYLVRTIVHVHCSGVDLFSVVKMINIDVV